MTPASERRQRVGKLWIRVLGIEGLDAEFDRVTVTIGDGDCRLSDGDFDQCIGEARNMMLDLAGVISALERLQRWERE